MSSAPQSATYLFLLRSVLSAGFPFLLFMSSSVFLNVSESLHPGLPPPWATGPDSWRQQLLAISFLARSQSGHVFGSFLPENFVFFSKAALAFLIQSDLIFLSPVLRYPGNKIEILLLIWHHHLLKSSCLMACLLSCLCGGTRCSSVCRLCQLFFFFFTSVSFL